MHILSKFATALSLGVALSLWLAGIASAQVVNLTAAQQSTTLPDGNVVPSIIATGE